MPDSSRSDVLTSKAMVPSQSKIFQKVWCHGLCGLGRVCPTEPIRSARRVSAAGNAPRPAYARSCRRSSIAPTGFIAFHLSLAVPHIRRTQQWPAVSSHATSPPCLGLPFAQQLSLAVSPRPEVPSQRTRSSSSRSTTRLTQPRPPTSGGRSPCTPVFQEREFCL